MFEVDASNYNAETSTIPFLKGGFQGARGDNNGDEFYIENIMEELDTGAEWFYNKTTKTLYYFNNETGSPDNLIFEATNLTVLVNYTGTMDKPVKNQ